MPTVVVQWSVAHKLAISDVQGTGEPPQDTEGDSEPAALSPAQLQLRQMALDSVASKVPCMSSDCRFANHVSSGSHLVKAKLSKRQSCWVGDC